MSLEGPETHNDLIRGKGSFRRTAQGIEKALEAGIDIFIFTTVSKSLLPVLPQFAFEVYNRFFDIKYLTLIQLIGPSEGAFELFSELLEPDDFLKLVRMVSLLNLSGHKIEILNNPLGVVAAKLLEIYRIPEAKPLCRDDHLIVLADRNVCLSHSKRTGFGKFKAGMIEKVLISDGYQKAVKPDETTCPACSYSDLCAESGMVRPSESYRDSCREIPYCKRVLDIAAT